MYVFVLTIWVCINSFRYQTADQLSLKMMQQD